MSTTPDVDGQLPTTRVTTDPTAVLAAVAAFMTGFHEAAAEFAASEETRT
jgi:hypothetical protein